MRNRYVGLAMILVACIAVAICLSVVCHGSCSLPAEILDDDWEWMYISFSFSMPMLAVLAIINPKGLANITAVSTPWVFIVYGGILSVWGIMQIYGYSYSNHSLYSLTGPFYNPGPYSGYIAMILPICMNEWLKQGSANRWLSYIPLSAMLLIICLLPAGMSRSAWIAAALSSLYVACMHYRIGIRNLVSHYKNRIMLFATVLLIIVPTAIGCLYLMKKDSADGRILIWKISAYAIAGHPLTGSGWKSVPAVYGQAQENYFAKGNHTASEETVAGSPEYVFNEYLQAAIAWGIPMTCLILLIIAGGFYIGNKKGLYGICGALLSLSIFSFSSYPFQFPTFVSALVVMVFVCYAQLLTAGKCILRYFMAVLLLSIAIVSYIKYEQEHKITNACRKWMECRLLYRSGAYLQAVESYADIKECLKDNASFMFEYGHALHKLHRSEMSNEILNDALALSGDPMILNIIGKNEQEMKNYEEAESFFLRSVHRLPGRIYPYYLLAKLYSIPEYYNYEKLRWASNQVLHKEPKVQSTAIKQMRDEIRKVVRINHSSQQVYPLPPTDPP